MNITGRINRILFILSYVSQNQGITVDVLAEKVGMRPRQLVKELEFISLIGKPPFKPDDYIDIYVEEQGVFIEFDQKLNRPLRFTRPEAIAILMSLELLDHEVIPEGEESLKQKIGHAIANSIDSASRLEDRIILEQSSHLISNHFKVIHQAVESRNKVKIQYYALARNETSTRVIQPYLLTKHLGSWYLTGFCEMRNDLRTFKFERILSVSLLAESFSAPEDFDIGKYSADFFKLGGVNKIEILFDAHAAPYIKEQWGSRVKELPDGGALLTLDSETLEFPSRLVIGNAPHARPLSPPEFVEKVKADAREILALQKPG